LKRPEHLTVKQAATQAATLQGLAPASVGLAPASVGLGTARAYR